MVFAYYRHPSRSCAKAPVEGNLVVRTQLSFGFLVAFLFADFLRQFFHKYNFIDPGTGVYTQTVERMWGLC